MIKVAFVIDGIESPTGGTEKQLLMLLNGLNREKYSPYLLVLKKSEWMKSQNFDFPVIDFEVDRIFGWKTVDKVKQMAAFCRTEKIDIVQTFFVDANIFGTVGAHRGGCPVIISSRRNIGHWQKSIDVAILRFLRRFTNYYIANSRAAAVVTIRNEHIQEKRVRVIYNGINLDHIASITPEMRFKQRNLWKIKEERYVIGSIANLRQVKNIDLLIAAAANIVREFPEVHFVVVGEGPERDTLGELIEEKKISGNFTLAGSYQDVIPCLAAFDAAVLTSSHESFSNSLIEYMAAGLPIAATSVGGNIEAICNGREGILFPAGNVDKLTEALRDIITNHELARHLGENAKNKAYHEYSREGFLKNHEQFYMQALREVGTNEKNT
ncbi:putative Glycosyl transferase group 1 [Candidatus Zixiibacteriota bacterium]|nr:putative Glycosyl transferase group 1 [candidate division Zixibacteria bacterium]